MTYAEMMETSEHVAYWYDIPSFNKKRNLRTETQTVTGTDSALLYFWSKQQELAAKCGVEIEEAD